MEEQNQQIEFSQETHIAQVKYAGFWIRWVANFIDGLVLIIPNIIVGLVVKFLTAGTVQSIFASVSSLLVSWIYFILMTNKYQATLGKKALGLQVVSDKAESLTLGQIILRETIGKLISMVILFFGYMMAGFTKRKQALHDKIASTLVIYKDPNKKVTVWVIVVVIVVSLLVMTAIIGILASIVLVSLNSARNKAQDAATKASISSVIPAAIIYQDDKGTLKGFVPNFGIQFKDCTGTPIVNISPDGKDMAIFAKLCDPKSQGKYFCDDLNSNSVEADESYAKSGKAICPGSSPALQETSQNSTTGSINTVANSNGLFANVSDDLAMINIASETAKKWQPDAQAYVALMISSSELPNEHAVIFKSKNKPGKMFGVSLDFSNKIVGSSEEQDSIGDIGYINSSDLKFSSAKAFQASEDLVKGKLKGALADYDTIFVLSYVKEANANVWVYTLANKKVASDVVKVLVDASSGKILGSSLK